MVRTTSDPVNSLSAIRRELSLVDRQVAVLQIRTLPEILDRNVYAQPRFSLSVLGSFAATETLLVAVGVFSVMVYAVSLQKKDCRADGARCRPLAHVRGHLPAGRAPACGGRAAGILASFATNRLLATQLWNISPYDPLTLAGATILVSLIALTACYIPGRRAMQVEPIAALRED